MTIRRFLSLQLVHWRLASLSTNSEVVAKLVFVARETRLCRDEETARKKPEMYPLRYIEDFSLVVSEVIGIISFLAAEK